MTLKLWRLFVDQPLVAETVFQCLNPFSTDVVHLKLVNSSLTQMVEQNKPFRIEKAER